ncbi:MAG: hypothetical protein DWQ34_28265 [Planctomycetota bacterium]|nr:MAG: hypothetical protein DWQ34_28265 [Planctomycetota bacterium]
MRNSALAFRPSIAASLAAMALAVAVGLPVTGQSRKPRPDSPANLKALDQKAEDLQRSYLTGLYDLAEGYEDAGQLEKAKQALQEILKIKPDAEGVKTRLQEIEDAVFDGTSHVVEVDASKGWITTGVFVKKDQPVRLTADGTYRYIVNESLGPEGFRGEDVMRDMASDVPNGAVMALIVPPPQQGQRQPPKPSGPFTIGKARDLEPPADGMLLLRINVPPGSKCIGKLKVTLSGNIQPNP